jgi:hypothetical protein
MHYLLHISRRFDETRNHKVSINKLINYSPGFFKVTIANYMNFMITFDPICFNSHTHYIFCAYKSAVLSFFSLFRTFTVPFTVQHFKECQGS